MIPGKRSLPVCAAVIQLVQVITVLGKDELQIQFNYQDEYEKALALITPVQERMVV